MIKEVIVLICLPAVLGTEEDTILTQFERIGYSIIKENRDIFNLVVSLSKEMLNKYTTEEKIIIPIYINNIQIVQEWINENDIKNVKLCFLGASFSIREQWTSYNLNYSLSKEEDKEYCDEIRKFSKEIRKSSKEINFILDVGFLSQKQVFEKLMDYVEQSNLEFEEKTRLEELRILEIEKLKAEEQKNIIKKELLAKQEEQKNKGIFKKIFRSISNYF